MCKIARFVVIYMAFVPMGQFIRGDSLVFPHIADGNIGDGTRWSTEIDLSNNAASKVTVTVSFFNPGGTPKVVGLPGFGAGGPGSSNSRGFGAVFTFPLDPKVMRVLTLDTASIAYEPLSPVTHGWVWVESTDSVRATVLFRRVRYARPDLGESFEEIRSEAGVLPAPSLARIEFIPRVPWAFGTTADPQNPSRAEVGYAMVNPSATSAVTGTIELADATGQILGTASFTLVPRGKIAEFVSERFSTVALGAGYIRMRTQTGVIAVVALRLLGTGLVSTISAN